jgi:lipopolysaccharide export system protein LptA
MPYPVSPPALPPVADVVLAESHDRSGADPSLSATQAQLHQPEHLSQSEPAPSENSPTCSEESCNRPSLISSEPPLAGSATAEGLGTPLSVGGSASLSATDLTPPEPTSEGETQGSVLPSTEPTQPFDRAESAILQADPRFTTLLQMPELEDLIQAGSTQPQHSTRANPNLSNSTGSNHPNRDGDQLRSAPSAESNVTRQADLSQNPNQENIYLEDSIRLDLPIPEPSASPPADRPAQPSIEPSGDSLPAPAPAPSGGQILTIPTPSRTRSEDSDLENNPENDADDPAIDDPAIDEPDSGEAEPPTAAPVILDPTVPDPVSPDRGIPDPTPDPTVEGTPPAGTPPAGAAVPIDPQAVGEVLEVTADRQEFDERQQIFRADGNVVVRFRQGELTANRVRVNIPNRVAVAEGNGVLTRGSQVLRGERFSYNFGLNQGTIETARGELFIPATQQDFQPAPIVDATTTDLTQPITQRVATAQPLQVQGGVPGLSFGFGNNSSLQGGTVNRLRFEADRAEFMGDSLVAENVRITNDPFSPPELELRSSRVTYNRLSPTRAEIRARNPRLVFDQGFSLPLLVNRLVLDSRQRDSGLLSFGYDEDDRDGFYIERSFDVYSSPPVYFSLTPQILVQRAFEQGGFPDPDQFGLVGNLDLQFTPTTSAQAIANLSSLDFEEVEDNLRASVRLRQLVYGHTVALDYSYRDRLFNGSLGFQDIQSSVGLVVFSPRYVLGTSGINLNYQGSVQYINAQTDQRSLLPLDRTNEDLIDEDLLPEGVDVEDVLPLDPNRDLSCIDPDDRDVTGNGCADLTRYQAAIVLSRFFPLWYGTALPPTPTEGLRYTPTPVVPYVGVSLEARGVTSAYSNGDSQSSLRGGVVLLGQFGNFSRPVFDYTSFVLVYFNTLRSGESPFLFDRISDDQFVVASITQQIYGPLRFGVQVAYNLDTSDEIDTVYSLEYSRRTYSISATYSTGRESAALTLRLNDFNWTGDPGPFSGLGSGTVEGGLIRN